MKKITLFDLQITKEERKYFIYYFLVGLISVLAQTILLRELVVEVFGNEIIYSIFLSTWLLMVAMGSFLYKKFPVKQRFQNAVYISLSLLVLLIPIQFLFIRLFVEQLSVISGIVINISSLFLLAIAVLSPGCLIIGYLFPVNSHLHSRFTEGVKKVYIFESMGMLVGGILFYLLIQIFKGFSILIFVGALAFFLLYLFSKKRIFILGIIAFISLMFFSHSIFITNYQTRYEPEKLIASHDSKYGRFDITKSHDQKNYFWDGVLFANSENENYAQEMVNFVLLQHSKPSDVLLVGGLLNNYPQEFLAYGGINIDYLEIDENVLKASEFYQDRNPAVNLIQKDALLYLHESNKKYDIIYFDVPDPSSLFLNRYYTNDFFDLIKAHLKGKNSVAAITISNAENYMLPELANLNNVVYNTFSESFSNIVIIPAQKNIFVASNDNYITNDVDELIARMEKKNLQSSWFNQSLIFDTCNEFRVNKIKSNISEKTSEINNVLEPAAFLSTIQYWLKHLDKSFSSQINFLKNNKTIVFFLLLILIWFLAFLNKTKSVGVSGFIENSIIVSTSLVAFVMQIVLLYLFQVYHGYIYYVVAIFTSSFMLGLTLGFLAPGKIKRNFAIVLFLNTLLLIFILLLVQNKINPIYYFIFNLALSIFEGMILSSILMSKNKEESEKGATFYFADTIGAFLGGLIFGVVLLPVYGIKLNIKFLAIIVFIHFILSLIYNIINAQKETI